VLFADYAARWTASVPAPAEWFTYSTVVEGGREFPLLGLRLPGRHTVLLTAGFHGDEKAGPLTLLDHTPEIVAYAVERGAPGTLDPLLRPAWDAAGTDAARRRVIVDQVASLTDTSAIAWHHRLCGPGAS